MENFINRVAPYYHYYINLVTDKDAILQLKESLSTNYEFLSKIQEEKTLYAYAPGKWTIKEVLGHIIDTERVFAYRAMRIARNDHTNLPGFEQDDYVKEANFNKTKWSDLLQQYKTLRESNIALFSSFDDEALNRDGTANNSPTNVKALIYITAGHEIHHMNVLKEKYLKE